MLSSESEVILSDLLMKIIQGERSVEFSRRSLANLFEFNPEGLFYSLCKSYRTELVPRDFKDFLIENEVDVSDEVIYLLVRQYSALQNGRLSFDDFTHLVLPATNELAARLVLERSYPRVIDGKVIFYFISLLKAELKLQREAEDLKSRLFKESDFSLWKAFETLNKSGTGYINDDEICEFLKKHKSYIGIDDYDALMRRIDLQDDLVINYNEFLEALIPMQIPRNNETRPKKVEDTKRFDVKQENLENKVENPDEEEENYRQDVKNPRKLQENVEEAELEHKVSEEKQDSQDDRMDSNELERSPRFQDTKEFTLSGQFETPEKQKSSKPRSMPNKRSGESLETIGRLLLAELDSEKKRELYRQSVVMMENFSVLQLFAIIDEERKGEISINDLEKLLKDLNVQSTKETLHSLFREYGDKQSLTMNLDDFTQIFLCSDKEYSDQLQKESDELLNQETIDKITQFFHVLVDSESKIFEIKKECELFAEKDLIEAFEFFDIDKDGLVSVEDIKNALRRFGVLLSNADGFSLIKKYAGDEYFFTFEQFKDRLIAVEEH